TLADRGAGDGRRAGEVDEDVAAPVVISTGTEQLRLPPRSTVVGVDALASAERLTEVVDRTGDIEGVLGNQVLHRRPTRSIPRAVGSLGQSPSSPQGDAERCT